MECFDQIKKLVSLIPHSNQEKAAKIEPKKPKFRKNIENIIPSDPKQPYDVRDVIFALTVKGLVMVLGFAGYASMWAAVFADTGVAMLCVLNSIRILYGHRN